MRGSGPLRDGGNIISEGGVVNFVDKNTKEGSSLFVGIRLKLRIDLDDECGGDCREQSRLILQSTPVPQTRCKTHEDQSVAQIVIVLLNEFLVVFPSDLLIVLVELSLIVLVSGWYALIPAARGS